MEISHIQRENILIFQKFLYDNYKTKFTKISNKRRARINGKEAVFMN